MVPRRKTLAILIFTASLALIGTAALAGAAGDDDSSTTVLGYEIARDRISVPEDWGVPNTK
ncbi:MAG: hypothetical protein BZY87_02985 [SAR202 cluster bacterium Io17-Chloro-G6]|nr:MAG: hypothetical protein BZY87_02985 [SAR202 cluster bacterium Io17-Chloro-G6]